MEPRQIIALAVGAGVPIVLAPLAVIGLRPLFSIFLAEGAELFADMSIERSDARVLGSLLAKINVVVLLLAWLALWTCGCFEQHYYLLAGIGVGGLLAAMWLTTTIVKNNLQIEGRTMLMVGLLAFTGGNLPIIIIAAALAAIL